MSLTWLQKDVTGFYGKAMTVGLIKTEEGIALIDSGLEGGFIKKVVKALKEDDTLSQDQGVHTLLNTHAHADHIGGNHWLATIMHPRVIAPAKEKPFIEFPGLEGHYLFGAEPPVWLTSKHFLAMPSRVDQTLDFSPEPRGPIAIDLHNRRLLAYDFSGHSPGMVGYQEESGIFFLGDLVFTEDTIDKHKILFAHDILKWLESLDRLKDLPASGYVLSHGGFFDSADLLIEKTRRSLLDLQERIYKLVQATVTDADLHRRLSDQLALFETPAGYLLNHSTIRAHLTALEQQRLVTCDLHQGELIWKSRLE